MWCQILQKSHNFQKNLVFRNKTFNWPIPLCCECKNIKKVVEISPKACTGHFTFWTAITSPYGIIDGSNILFFQEFFVAYYFSYKTRYISTKFHHNIANFQKLFPSTGVQLGWNILYLWLNKTFAILYSMVNIRKLLLKLSNFLYKRTKKRCTLLFSAVKILFIS